MSATIKFCGAAGTVTGSCYWIKTGQLQLLVDCGMFQGSKTVKQLNYDRFPFDPREIDLVLLTHAHTDHAGLLPKLVKHGFSGPIYATAGTRDLLTYMLPDSAHIQGMEVKRVNIRNSQRGLSRVSPIYDLGDVERCLSQIVTIPYDSWLESGPIKVKFWNAGHILGAASIELHIYKGSQVRQPMRLLFSGDIGPDHKAFHPDPDAPAGIDYLFCESTYGERQRAKITIEERRSMLAGEINEAMNAGGALVIPSFAVERTQELLLDLANLLRADAVPSTSVFIDSPLAIKITSVFEDHAAALEDLPSGRNLFANTSFHFTESTDESKAIARFTGGIIILAASGMCDAGRIRHHLKNHLWRPQSTILLVGYQAEGTLGRLLMDGVKKVKIQGEEIAVKARIRSLDAYSGHADRDELVDWVHERLPVRHAVFLTHGSAGALSGLKQSLKSNGIPAQQIVIPKLDDRYELSDHGFELVSEAEHPRLEPAAFEEPDWHNDLAEFSLDLRSVLEASASDRQRIDMLKRLKDALNDRRLS